MAAAQFDLIAIGTGAAASAAAYKCRKAVGGLQSLTHDRSEALANFADVIRRRSWLGPEFSLTRNGEREVGVSKVMERISTGPS